MILVGRNREKLTKQAEELRQEYDVTVKIIAADLAKPEAAQEIYDTCCKNGWTVDDLIKANGRIAISAFDGPHLKGYQIKGHAQYIESGAVVDNFKKVVEDMFKGAATAKGALEIIPEKVIVTTPGPGQQEGTLSPISPWTFYLLKINPYIPSLRIHPQFRSQKRPHGNAEHFPCGRFLFMLQYNFYRWLLVIVFRRFLKRDVNGLFTAIAADGQGRGITDFMLGNLGAHVVNAVDFGTIDFQDDIAFLQAGFVSRAAGGNLEDIDALFDVELIAVTGCGLLVEDGNAEERTGDIPFGHDGINDILYCVGRNGEANALDAVRNNLRAVDADDFAVHINEGTAGVAWVNGSISLQKFDAFIAVPKRAVLGADDAVRYRALEFKPHRIADGDDGFTDDNLVRIAKVSRRQIAVINADDCEVREFIRADKCALEAAAIGERDDELTRTFDNVIVRHDIALAIVVLENDTRANTLALDWIIEPIAGHGLIRNADHSRTDGLSRTYGRRIACIRKIVVVGFLLLLHRRTAGRAIRARRRAQRAAGKRRSRQGYGQSHGQFFIFFAFKYIEERFHENPSIHIYSPFRPFGWARGRFLLCL